jgi:hypothetical protein
MVGLGPEIKRASPRATTRAGRVARVCCASARGGVVTSEAACLERAWLGFRRLRTGTHRGGNAGRGKGIGRCRMETVGRAVPAAPLVWVV